MTNFLFVLWTKKKSKSIKTEKTEQTTELLPQTNRPFFQKPQQANCDNKQLLDEVEDAIMNYQNHGLSCFHKKMQAQGLIIHDIM